MCAAGVPQAEKVCDLAHDPCDTVASVSAGISHRRNSGRWHPVVPALHPAGNENCEFCNPDLQLVGAAGTALAIRPDATYLFDRSDWTLP